METLFNLQKRATKVRHYAISKKVIAIDIDPIKLECARHNAKIYGVQDRIEFLLGNVFDILPTLESVDVVFMSPPWGGKLSLRIKC